MYVPATQPQQQVVISLVLTPDLHVQLWLSGGLIANHQSWWRRKWTGEASLIRLNTEEPRLRSGSLETTGDLTVDASVRACVYVCAVVWNVRNDKELLQS